MSRIIAEATTIADIPALVVAPEGAAGLPVVIYVHGFGQDKASGTEIAYRLADRGIAAVSIDARMHGARHEQRLSDAFDPGKNVFPPESGMDVGLVYNRCVVETADDVGRLMAALSADSRFDRDRIGVSGFSMGGVVAYLAAARYPHIKAAAPIGAVPSQLERWRDVVFETSTYPEWAEAVETNRDRLDETLTLLKTNDPLPGLLRFAPKPLLMVNGDRDTDQPKHYGLRLMEKLRPLYAGQPDNLRISLPPVEHRLTTGIIREVCSWFETHL